MLNATVGLDNNHEFAAASSVVLSVLTFVLSFGFMRLADRKRFGS